jgi:Flp pilus assembly protein TadG
VNTPRVRLMTTASHWAREERGAAAVEFTAWLLIVLWPLLNVVDLGLYVFQQMQVNNAGQAAVAQVFNNCGQTTVSPILTNCSSTKVTNGANAGAYSTSLGTNVTVAYKTECVGGALKSGGDPAVTACPSGMSTGDYIGVTVAYTYHPLFPNLTVTSILNSAMGKIAWMRMS